MEKIDQIKKLYQEAFGDTKEYVDYVFDKVYTESKIRYEEKDGNIVSVLGILPRSFSYAKKSVPGAFISGVVTAESERKKGTMKGLMKRVLREFSAKQCAVVFLSPKKDVYYISQGFRTILKANLMEIKPCDKVFKTKVVENPQEYHFMKVESSKDFSVTNLRSNQFCEKLFGSYITDGTQVKKVYDNEKYLGYFVDDKLGIFEYTLPVKYLDKVKSVSSKWFVFGEGESFTMARILNPFLLFSDIYCEKDVDTCFTVVDNFLEREYGVRFLAKNGRLNCLETDACGQKIIVEQLTEWAFGVTKVDAFKDICIGQDDLKISFSDRYL